MYARVEKDNIIIGLLDDKDYETICNKEDFAKISSTVDRIYDENGVPMYKYLNGVAVFRDDYQDAIAQCAVADFRRTREKECFPVVNRGKVWYDTLTAEQEDELKQWYKEWLDVTETKVKPTKPEWLR